MFEKTVATLPLPKIKVGVIGVGIGAEHLECYHRLSDRVEIVSICNLNPERSAVQSALYGTEHVCTDYRDLLAFPGLEAVSVCVPNDLHAEMSVAVHPKLSAFSCGGADKPPCQDVSEDQNISLMKFHQKKLLSG